MTILVSVAFSFIFVAYTSIHLTMALNNNSALKSQKEQQLPVTLLDLPDLALECILGLLSPVELSIMTLVCTSLRKKCKSDHFWHKHLKEKWGRVLCDVAYRLWQWHKESKKKGKVFDEFNQLPETIKSFYDAYPCLYDSTSNPEPHMQPRILLSDDSVLAWYVALETGQFWLPAEIQSIGVNCVIQHYFHALVGYESRSHTFMARYPRGKWDKTLKYVPWNMVRATPVDTPPHVLHASDCLNHLKPGDHIEIQRRGREEAPYDWMHAVVGHLESCDENENHCLCLHSDTLVVLLNLYQEGSPFRRLMLNRKEDKAKPCIRVDGTYGGLRKLSKRKEIEDWMQIRPGPIKVEWQHW